MPGPGLGEHLLVGLLFLVYLGVGVFVLVLLVRFVRAAERAASALESLACRPPGT